jgi:Zn-finger in ubiquitin-hydrolases and other protein
MKDRHARVRGINPAAGPSGDGCVECLASGGWWLHLRRCAECGHIGCCDNSPSQHATKHFHLSGHPVIASFEPGEDWFYDYETGQEIDAFRVTGVRYCTRPDLLPRKRHPWPATTVSGKAITRFNAAVRVSCNCKKPSLAAQRVRSRSGVARWMRRLLAFASQANTAQ